MQTVAFDLTQTEWTRISGAHGTVAVDIKTAAKILAHLNTGDTPALDAPAMQYGSWADGPDIVFEGLSGSDALWCRAVEGSARIVVVRK